MELHKLTPAVLLLFIIGGGWCDDLIEHNTIRESAACPCEDELLCMSLGEAQQKNASAPHVQKFIQKSQKAEVFAFVLKCEPSVWMKFNWTKLTTIAIVGFYDSNLLCHAHKNGVRVVKLGNFEKSELTNVTARQKWIKLQVSDVTLKFLDGINLDFESAIDPYTPEQWSLTRLVKETSEAFHSTLPNSQVSFDVAWSAKGIDGRFYDYAKIAAACDLIFIMAYDEQSQIFHGPCTARQCNLPYQGGTVSWVNCSDAAGKQFAFSWMTANRHTHNATYQWDQDSLTPFYNYKESDGQIHQTRYDDASSLTYKYMLAVTSGLRGVGMWTANYLDYTDDDPHATHTRQLMWSLLP